MELSALEKASWSDKDKIVSLIRGVVDHLNQIGIPQWDDVYPTASNVEEDIRNGQLYVVRAGEKIAGIITLNQAFHPDYRYGDWQYQGPDFAVVHRICVSPDMQGFGIGARLMRMAEHMLCESGVKSIRLDAFTRNPHSLGLYEKLGYRIAGEVVWRKGRFYLMEKDITAQR